MMVLLFLLCYISLASPDESFSYYSYDEMVDKMYELERLYPTIVHIEILQTKYNLSYPKELACNAPNQPFTPCKHYMLHITNHTTLTSDRPEVFFSGAVHGDERIGPNAVMELAIFLCSQATLKGKMNELQSRNHEWISTLVSHRSVYLLPMSNAYGYYHKTREENGIDPNRDFNYMTDACMQTMTGRVINELFRDHIFQLAITFHGGVRAIGYEWGTPNHIMETAHKSQYSPDHYAQEELAQAMSFFGGRFNEDGNYYPYGPMTDLVYEVTGGMEDWAYAASWENQYTTVENDQPIYACKTDVYGGYPTNKTVYNNVTHRCFNFLVETSNEKEPEEASLGFKNEVYDVDLQKYTKTSIGHIARNIRVALFLIEMVEPYLQWILPSEVTTKTLTIMQQPKSYATVDHEVFPSLSKTSHCFDGLTKVIVSCQKGYCTVNNSTTRMVVLWEVLGSFHVDGTYLQVSTSSSFSSADTYETRIQRGLTRRSPPANSKTSKSKIFLECINVTDTPYYVRAVALVDKHWASQKHPNPQAPPQAHIVNIRTNAEWSMENQKSRVKGRVRWFSEILEINNNNIPQEGPRTNSIPNARSVYTFLLCGIISCCIIITMIYKLRTRQKRQYVLVGKKRQEVTTKIKRRSNEEKSTLTHRETEEDPDCLDDM